MYIGVVITIFDAVFLFTTDFIHIYNTHLTLLLLLLLLS